MILLCDKLYYTRAPALVSGLARRGNGITLPLPNLVAKLAILLRSVLCGHYCAVHVQALFKFFFFANPLLTAVVPFHSSVCF